MKETDQIRAAADRNGMGSISAKWDASNSKSIHEKTSQISDADTTSFAFKRHMLNRALSS